MDGKLEKDWKIYLGKREFEREWIVIRFTKNNKDKKREREKLKEIEKRNWICERERWGGGGGRGEERKRERVRAGVNELFIIFFFLLRGKKLININWGPEAKLY